MKETNLSKLQSMLKDKLQAWIPVDGYEGFEVELAYLSRPELEKIRKRVTKLELNKRTRAMEETLDTDAYTNILIKSSLLNWKGFTLEHALKLLPIEVSEGANLKEEIEFNEEDAIDLVKNSPTFDQWLNEAIYDLDNFRKK